MNINYHSNYYIYIYISHLNGKSLHTDDIPYLKYFTTHPSLDVVRQTGDVLCPKYSLKLPPNSLQHDKIHPVMVIIWMSSQSSQLLLLTACYNNEHFFDEVIRVFSTLSAEWVINCDSLRSSPVFCSHNLVCLWKRWSTELPHRFLNLNMICEGK